MRLTRNRQALALAVFVGVAYFAAASAQETEAPKNIIVMIADGWSYNHIVAARFYARGAEGEEVYESFHHMAMATYSADGHGYDPAKPWKDSAYVNEGATDSAAAATAMSTGVLTRNGVIGLDPEGKPLRHIVDVAEARGKATGVVSSVPLAHATPAGFVAHNKSRNDYPGISAEMILESPLEVIMGAGHPYYDNDGKRLDPGAMSDKRYVGVGGKDTWDQVQAGAAGADADGDGKPDPWVFIETRGQFQQLADGGTPDRVLGVPQVEKTLQQERAGDGKADPFEVPLTETVPTLEEMTQAALNVLDNDPDGFFVMIEGGAVDWASHDNQSGRVIEEMLDFNASVEAVVNWVEAHSSWDETLLVVTGDHECGYLTGRDGYDVENLGKGNVPGMKWNSGKHTNSLIPLYAKGPGATTLTGFVEGVDPRRGRYIHSSAIAKAAQSLWAPTDTLAAAAP